MSFISLSLIEFPSFWLKRDVSMTSRRFHKYFTTVIYECSKITFHSSRKTMHAVNNITYITMGVFYNCQLLYKFDSFFIS
jgi:hypothetical protein